MSIASILVGALASPITSSIVEIVKDYNGKKVDVRQIEADVSKKISEAVAQVSNQQANVIMAELNGPDRISRIWRPVVALSCVGTLLFYGIVSPVMVAWFGFPPVKVGDTLLSWIFTLASTGMAGYLGSVTIENLAKTWSKR